VPVPMPYSNPVFDVLPRKPVGLGPNTARRLYHV